MSLCKFPAVVSRYVRPLDGKIATLISPGRGSGWSTECPTAHVETALFDADIVAAVLARDWASVVQLAEIKIPGFVTAGAPRLVVAWMEAGEEFWVGMQGGHEFIIKHEMETFLKFNGDGFDKHIFVVA